MSLANNPGARAFLSDLSIAYPPRTEDTDDDPELSNYYQHRRWDETPKVPVTLAPFPWAQKPLPPEDV